MASVYPISGIATGSALLHRSAVLLSSFALFWLILLALTRIEQPDTALEF